MANNDKQSSDSGNNIQVFVRIRPPCPDEPAYSRVVDVDSTGTQIILQNNPAPRTFSFDYVADINSMQESIFHHLGKKVIENCVAGYNGTIFAYGQTGSGKTFTMLGPSEDADNFQSDMRGVVPRSFECLYNLIAREKELHGEAKQFLCKCSFLEIYNEQIFDLLEPSTNSLHLRESFKTGVYVSGLSEQVVADASEAYMVLCSSWRNRKVASTSMNRESSRSHAVFTLQIESKEQKGAVEHIRTSQLHLVDLAGSERQKDTGAMGLRLKEASSINKSLSNLGNVIMTLVSVSRDNKKRYIPYRDSKLTFLLRDSLGGNAKTSLIACVHPGHRCYGETLSTLQFAKRAKMIKNKAVLNENSMGNIMALQAEIKTLKDELSKYRSGAIVQQPSVTAPVENLPELKVMFIQAMYMVQKNSVEKQDLEESLAKLKEVIEKKDKAIQTNKMIIKFRDNNVQRLENKLKGVDVNVSHNEDIEKELQALRTQLDHHPQLARYALEVKQLRTSINKLREEPGTIEHVQKDGERVRALENMFMQLVAEQQGIHEEPQLTPQRSEMVATATLEKLRSQNKDLEAKLEELNNNLQETKQNAEKKELHMKNVVESSENTIKELQILLSANTTKTKLEKAAINEQHLQTVKTMLTPKKECYKLRNRTISRPSTSTDADCIPFETVEEEPADDGITGEDLTEVFAQQENEALLDRIKQLQDQVSSMEERLTEYETGRVQQMHQISLLESEVKDSQQFLNDEQKMVMTLKEELRQVEPRLKNALEERDAALGEITDLKLILSQADREIKEYKENSKSVDSKHTERMDTVLSKVSELDRAVQQLAKDNEKLEEEKELIISNLETEIATREFYESRNSDNDIQLNTQKETIEALEKRLQEVEGSLAEEKTEREMLVEQLRSVGQEKEQEVLNRVEENKMLQKDYEHTCNMLEGSQLTVDKLKSVIEEKDDRVLHLQKENKHAEEKITELFSRLRTGENEVEELQERLETYQEEIKFYKNMTDEQASARQGLETKLVEVEEKARRDIGSCQVEYDMALDDLGAQNDQLREQVTSTEKDKLQLQEEVRELAEKLKSSEATVAQLSAAEVIVHQRSAESQQNAETELRKLGDQLNFLNNNLQDKQRQIMELKKNNEKLEETKGELENFKKSCADLQYRLDKRTEDLESVKSCLVSEETKLKELDVKYQNTKHTLEEKRCMLGNVTFEVQCIKEEKEILEDSVQRLQDLARKDGKEKDELKDENSRILRELETYKMGLEKINSLYKDTLRLEEDSKVSMDDVLTIFTSTWQEKEELHEQVASLGGHSNHKQKISIMHNYKQRLISAEEENRVLSVKNKHLEEQIQKLHQDYGKVKDTGAEREPLKENRKPAHKTFMSGDFSYRKT